MSYSYYNELTKWKDFDFERYFDLVSEDEILVSIEKDRLSIYDYLNLLSPKAQKFLEKMAYRAYKITRQYFGNVISLYIPIYVSNYCTSNCIYCGFSKKNHIVRRHMKFEEIEKEAEEIAKSGIENILLLTGEAKGLVDKEYLKGAIDKLKKYFSSVSIEVMPLEEKDYIIKHLFQTKQWAQLDQGVLSLQDAKKQLIEQIPDKKRDLIVYAFEHWFDYFDQFDEMEEFIKRYKGKGYQFYLLSNCSMQFYQYYQSKSIFQHFKELYTSAKYQKIKPNLDIYQDFLSRYHLKANECLFVDDLKENIDAAIKVGMKGFVYHQNIQELEKYIENIL